MKKQALNVYLYIQDVENFWPLSRTPILLRKIMGRELIYYFLEKILKYFKIKRLVILYEKGDSSIKIMKHSDWIRDVDVLYMGIESPQFEEIIEVVGSVVEGPTLISYALDYALLSEDFVRSILSRKSILMRSPIDNRFLLYSCDGKLSGVDTKVHLESTAIKFAWDFHTFSQHLLESKIKDRIIGSNVRISDGAKIIGSCLIKDNVILFENAVLKGPCYIGENTIIGNNSVIRGSIIENDSLIGANMEVARSWLGRKAETHSGYIGDSIFSNFVHTGAGFITANVRLDRKTIKVKFKGKRIDTSLPKLGVIIGERTEIGIHVGTMPGVLVGNEVVVGPGTLIFDNVEDGARIYIRQSVIVKEKSK